MKVLEVLKPEHINLNLKSRTKEGVIRELISQLEDIPEDKRSFIRKEVMEREAIKSTGIGHGIAIPHTETDLIEGIHVALGISKTGVNFLSLDGEPVYIFVLVIANKKLNLKYLSLLAHLARILSKKDVINKLKKASTPQKVIEVLKEVD